MNNYLKTFLKHYDLHDIDITVITDKKIVASHQITHPDVTTLPINSNSLFRVASISKLFVATAIMQLQEQNKLSIQDDVSSYFDFDIQNPYYKDIPITIEQLLTHTSSMQDTSHLYIPKEETLYELYDPNGTYYSTDQFIKKDGIPVKPGDHYTYYNTGFSILASIIELCSNKRFDSYINDHILSPLKMNGGFNISNFSTTEQSNIRALYRKDSDEKWIPQYDKNLSVISLSDYTLGDNGSIFSPQGGLRSNSTELSKFMIACMNDGANLLSKHSLHNMFQPRFTYNNSLTLCKNNFYRNCGLGFSIVRPKDANSPLQNYPHILVGHSGIAYGLLAIWSYDIVANNGIIAITTGHGNPLDSYNGTYSQYFNFEEELFNYVNNTYWTNKKCD